MITNLTLLWTRRIPVGNIGSIYLGDVDILVDHNYNNDEEYYITHTIKSRQDSYDSVSFALGILKLSSNGILLWHKSYSEFASGPLHLHDYPNSIVEIDTSGPKKFVIIGTREENFSWDRYLFAISIDQDGNILNNYKRLQTLTLNPNNPQAVWNPYNSSVACIFRENIGVLTMDNNLNPLSAKSFNGYCVNFPTSVTLQGDSSYVLGIYMHECPPYTNQLNPGF